MKYNIFLLNDTSKSVVDRLIKVADKSDNKIILPIIYSEDDKNINDYLYIREDYDKVEELMVQHDLLDLKYSSDESEVIKFVSNIKDKESDFNIGDLVKIKDYGNLIFTITDHMTDSYKCKLIMRDINYEIEVLNKLVFKHPDPDYFRYDGVSVESSKCLVVDCEYLIEVLDSTNIHSLVSYLIRLKFQFNKTRIVIWNPNEEVRNMCNGLMIPTSDNLPVGNYIFTNKYFLNAYYNYIFFENDGRIVRHNSDYITNKQNLFHSIIYLKQQGIIKESISLKNLIQYFKHNNIDDIYNRFKKYKPDLDKIINTKNNMVFVENVIPDFDKIKNEFFKHKSLKDYIENFDFFFKILYG